MANHPVPVRGTQRFIETLRRCWSRPSLTALEVLWRWACGIPVLWVLGYNALLILHAVPLQRTGIGNLSLLDPVGAAQILANAALLLMAPVLLVAHWLAPLLVAAWAVAAGLGRVLVLWRVRRLFPELAPLRIKPVTLILLQLVRTLALAATFYAWFAAVQWAARVAITTRLQASQPADLVQYAALVIVISLGLFTFWAVVSWIFSAAPMLTAVRGTGFFASMRGAFRLRLLTGKLVEVNLVLGIVKLALLVLAMVFSASPMPFESVTTDDFLHWWWLGVTLLYLVASDFFHVARMVGYLELFRAYEPLKDFPVSSDEIQYRSA